MNGRYVLDGRAGDPTLILSHSPGSLSLTAYRVATKGEITVRIDGSETTVSLIELASVIEAIQRIENA